MKRYIFLFLILSTALLARSRNGELGVGAEVGTIIDLNVKYHLSEFNAVEGRVSLKADKWTLFGASYRRHIDKLFDFERDLQMTYGLSGYLYVTTSEDTPFHGKDWDYEDEVCLSGAGTVGLSYYPDEIPFEFYTDIGAGITVIPESEMFFLFEIGVRIYLFHDLK